MATTKFTVKCPATGGEIVYYGYNCPREGEWIHFDGLDYQVINVTHIPSIPNHESWEEITIEVGEGRNSK